MSNDYEMLVKLSSSSSLLDLTNQTLMPGNSNRDSMNARQIFEQENKIETIMGPIDDYFKYDIKAHQSIVNAKPWEKDPHYFKWIKISAMALLKMLIHAQSGGNLEVDNFGGLQGFSFS